MAPRILVTGFAPFGGESLNPSWQAAQRLDGWTAEDHVVFAREIPCSFGASLAAFELAVAEVRPTAAILVGEAGGLSGFSVERVAVNLDDSEVPDNDGERAIERPVIADAPTAYFSSLPVKAIVADMRTAGLPASLSNSAGGFVCNHLFYGACHLKARRYRTMRVGFIHVPYALEQGERHPGAPTMAIEIIAEGLRIAVATTINDLSQPT